MFDNLKWFVLIHDFNSDEIRHFNIFNSANFERCLERSIKKYSTFAKFKEDLEGDLFYAFCSKAEYEIICSGLSSKYDREYKIDVYTQVMPNLDVLARYIITEINKRKRKKLEI